MTPVCGMTGDLVPHGCSMGTCVLTLVDLLKKYSVVFHLFKAFQRGCVLMY